jgi:DNA replication protein DnaC
MLMEQTFADLRSFNLKGMVESLSRQLEQPKSYDLSFEERLSLLVDAEKLYRKDKKLEKLLQLAKLRHKACMEDIDYAPSRGIKKEQMATLHSCQWIKDSLNVLITGATGTGKSWIGCALGQQACRQGLSVLYMRFSLLLEKIRLSRVEGTYTKFLKTLSKIELLILDDWLLEAIDPKDRHSLLEIVEDRYERGALLMTTQIPIQNWHEMIGDPTLADAILDRILNKSIKLELKGESMRKTKKEGAS